MKIDSLWLKIFGAIIVLNLVYWILSATILDFTNGISSSIIFLVYIAPVILPIAPFVDSVESDAAFLPIVGAMVVFFLPLFWSGVIYGVIRGVQMIRRKMSSYGK